MQICFAVLIYLKKVEQSRENYIILTLLISEIPFKNIENETPYIVSADKKIYICFPTTLPSIYSTPSFVC